VALVGRITGLAGGAIVIVGSFLHYVDSGLFKASFWKLAQRLDVIVLVVVLLAVVALALAFVTRPRELAAVAAALSGAVFGFVSDLDARNFNLFGVGFWLMSIGALAMIAGAVIAALAPNGGMRPAAAAPAGGGAGAAPPAGPPPGWYPDPSGQPGERYWSGQDWSDQTRP